MQVTITLLPVALSLVHIPRSRLPFLTNPILRQLLQPNPTFLNITCNEIELSIFAEHCDNDFSNVPLSPGEDQVEISDQKWNVLQIDTHSDQNGSGTSGHPFACKQPIISLCHRQFWRKSKRTLSTSRRSRHIHPVPIVLHV